MIKHYRSVVSHTTQADTSLSAMTQSKVSIMSFASNIKGLCISFLDSDLILLS